jgi:EF hand
MKFQMKSIRKFSLAPAAALCLITVIVQAGPVPSATPPSNVPPEVTSPRPMDSRANPENEGTPGDQDSGADSTKSMPGDERAFDALDSNHDGFISKLEGQQGGIFNYSDADRNGDGRLDHDEFGTKKAGTRSVDPTKPLSGADSRNSAASPKKQQ